ncbi:unnamed protein product [Allacma fusca]|uniref:Uncharacterized protein n=1 Tax=Allacma fusca TaxID=39272 RepID=A0A8J2K093_9HEXA|nr:unnamed protein product [Allacma fusca]
MKEAQRSNEIQSQSQARPQIQRNFWSLLDTNLPQKASALVSLVVQPFDTEGCGDRQNTRTCKADGGSGVSCPSCGYDLTNFLVNRREATSPTGKTDTSPQGNRNSTGSGSQNRKVLEGSTHSANKNPVQSNNPSQETQGRNFLTNNSGVNPNSQSQQSAEISRKKPPREVSPPDPTNATFNLTDYPVCIETIQNTPSVLSSSRIYMQDIKQDTGTERKPNNPEVLTQRQNKAIQTSGSNMGPCNLSGSINTPNSARNGGRSGTSVKSVKQPYQSSSHNNQKRSLQETQEGSNHTPISYHGGGSVEQPPNRRKLSQPTHISSEEKVQQWMHSNSNSDRDTHRSAHNQTASSSQQNNTNTKAEGSTIIEMATDFDLVSCGGAVAVEVDQNRRNSAGKESARNNKGASSESRNPNQDKQTSSQANIFKNTNESPSLPQESESFEVYEC